MRIDLSIPKPLSTILIDLNTRLAQEVKSNERLKWGLTAAVFVIYLAVVLFTSNQADIARTEYQRSQDQLNRLSAQITETRWPERAAQAAALVDRLNGNLWPGDTTGLAEASFERWVRQTFEEYGTEVRQVQLTRGPATEDRSETYSGTLSNVLRIRAKVIGPLREDALVNFLNDAAESQYWIIVEQLIIRSGRNPRFEIDLATFTRAGD